MELARNYAAIVPRILFSRQDSETDRPISLDSISIFLLASSLPASLGQGHRRACERYRIRAVYVDANIRMSSGHEDLAEGACSFISSLELNLESNRTH
jgi:hypothetical protein